MKTDAVEISWQIIDNQVHQHRVCCSSGSHVNSGMRTDVQQDLLEVKSKSIKRTNGKVVMWQTKDEAEFK